MKTKTKQQLRDEIEGLKKVINELETKLYGQPVIRLSNELKATYSSDIVKSFNRVNPILSWTIK